MDWGLVAAGVIAGLVALAVVAARNVSRGYPALPRQSVRAYVAYAAIALIAVVAGALLLASGH